MDNMKAKLFSFEAQGKIPWGNAPMLSGGLRKEGGAVYFIFIIESRKINIKH